MSRTTTEEFQDGFFPHGPSTDGSVVSPPIFAAGVGWDGKNTIVSLVATGSDADKAGLKPGDVVTAVHGIPIPSRDEFCKTFTGPPPRTVTTAAGTFDTNRRPLLRDGVKHTR